MLKKILPVGLATFALGIGLALTAPGTANAGKLDIHIGIGGGYGSGHYHYPDINHDGRKRYGHYKKGRHWHYKRVCRPGHAIHKAERRGVRRARIHRIGDRFVVVKGRRHGGKVKLAFYRNSHRCEMAWVKRSHRRNYGYIGDHGYTGDRKYRKRPGHRK